MTMIKRKMGSRAGAAMVGLAGVSLVLSACSSSGSSSGPAGNQAGNSAGNSASSGSSASGSSTINLTIGFPIALTGSNAFAGIDLANAAKLAVSDINSSGQGIHITLNEADTKGTTPGAIAAFNQVSPGSDIVAGIAYTQDAIALMPFAAKYQKPVLFLQATDLSGRSSNVFSMSPSQAPMMTDMIDTMPAKGVKSIGMIWDDAPFGQEDAAAAQSAAKAANIAVTTSTGVSLTATDFSAAELKTVQAKPDAIVLAALPNQSGLMANQIRALGYKGLLYGQQGDDDASFYKTAGAAAANNYQFYTFWDPAVASAAGQSLVTAYDAAYPSAGAPTVFAAIGWDAIQIIAEAVEKAGSTDSAKIINELNTATFTNTVLEPTLQFGSDGFVKANGYLMQYHSDGTKTKVKAF
jgi:branched-chain amino acid transport system substrate-binding protein